MNLNFLNDDEIIDTRTNVVTTQENGDLLASRKNGSPICSKLEALLLIHLTESIERFGSPLWYESERNEQFN